MCQDHVTLLIDIKQQALLRYRKKKMLLPKLRETRHENNHCLPHPQITKP